MNQQQLIEKTFQHGTPNLNDMQDKAQARQHLQQ
jgi:hypothetical protein